MIKRILEKVDIVWVPTGEPLHAFTFAPRRVQKRFDQPPRRPGRWVRVDDELSLLTHIVGKAPHRRVPRWKAFLLEIFS